jgi:hypothetical protein
VLYTQSVFIESAIMCTPMQSADNFSERQQ